MNLIIISLVLFVVSGYDCRSKSGCNEFLRLQSKPIDLIQEIYSKSDSIPISLTDCKDLQFITVFKMRSKLLVFISSKKWLSTADTSTVDLLVNPSSVTSFMFVPKGTTFRLVVKLEVLETPQTRQTPERPKSVDVAVDGEKYVFKIGLKDSYEIHTSKSYKVNDQIRVRADPSLNNSLSLSKTYLVFCFEKNIKNFATKCKPKFKDNHQIECECPEINSFLSFILILSFWLFMLFWIFYTKFKEPQMREPELLPQLVSCSVKTVQFQYLVEFRVGCPSDDFDFQETYIDFELLDERRVQISPEVRFAANKLPDPAMSVMRLLMGRLTPMPTIAYINAHHSGPLNSQLFWFDYTVTQIDLKNNTNNKELQSKAINEYIKQSPKTFKGKAEEEITYVPQLPAPELSWFEIQMFVFFFTAIIANFCQFILQSNESFIESLFSGLLSAILTTIIGILSLYVYQYILKKHEIEQKFIEGEDTNLWTIFRFVQLALMFVTILILTAIMAYFGFFLTLSQAIFWLGSCFIAAAIVFGIWYVSPEVLCLFRKVVVKKREDSDAENSSLASSPASVLSFKSGFEEAVSNTTDNQKQPSLSSQSSGRLKITELVQTKRH